MKDYTVYSNGLKLGSVKAGSFKSAEKKARKKYPRFNINLATQESFDDYTGHKKFKHSRNRTKDKWLMQ